MNRTAIVAYLALLSTVAFVGPKSNEEIDWSSFSGEASLANFQQNRALLSTLKGAYSVVLLEGLPHQSYEWKELQYEMENKPVEMINGFPFYRDKIVLKVDDVKKLKDYFDSAQSFSPSIGSKRCGGFHPDYCLQWTTLGGNTVNCFLCFGCEEIQLRQGDWYFHGDMRSLPLRTILYEYRKNRPLTPYLKRRIERSHDQLSSVEK